MSNRVPPTTGLRCLWPIISTIAILFSNLGLATSKTPTPPAASAFAKGRPPHHYCGLYCLYAAMRLAGRQACFRDLLSPEYVGSTTGSSLAELRKAAQDSGLHAVAVGNLTTSVLRNCPYHVILHVKSHVGSSLYNHYELFLGIQGRHARIFDPPKPVRLVPLRELAARWDGTGLVVSVRPIRLGVIFVSARKQFFMYAAIAVVIILLLRWSRQRLPRSIVNPRRKLITLSVLQAIGFPIIALVCGTLYHALTDEGLLANHTATAAIQRAHLSNFIPKITEKRLRRLLASGAVLIDARLKHHFNRGHIENAVSIPINASDDESAKAAAHIPKDARIVVYCQSAACRYADTVAAELTDDGFSNIYIYRPGWTDWITKHPAPPASGDTAAQTPGPNTPAQDTSAPTDPSQDAS